MALPFWVYIMSSQIIKKLGTCGLAIIGGLITKGIITSLEDLKEYLDSL